MQAQDGLRLGMALLGGEPVPVNGARHVLRHAEAHGGQSPHLELRDRMARLREPSEARRRLVELLELERGLRPVQLALDVRLPVSRRGDERGQDAENQRQPSPGHGAGS